MGTLVLHIGHHKTASSLLQRRVFPALDRTAFFLKRQTFGSREIVNAFGGTPALWRQHGNTWLESLQRDADERFPDGVERLLVSAEGMSAHKLFSRGYLSHGGSRRDPWRLASHLREAAGVAARASLGFKVVMLFRRQDQYLASRFASIGRHVGELSQTNFDTQVKEILDPNRRWCEDGIWLDHALIHELITGAVGSDGLLMLPYESLAMDSEWFLKQLGVFLETSLTLDPTNLAIRENTRSLAADTWKLQRPPAGRALEKLLASLPSALTPRLAPNRLKLTTDLQRLILERYSASNQRLAEVLDLDLGRYGYLSKA